MTTNIKYRPHRGQQTEFVSCMADQVLYGGSRGPGKSWALVYKAAFTPGEWHYERNGVKITKAQARKFQKEGKKVQAVADKLYIDYPEYQALIVRRSFPQLKNHIMPHCKQLYPMYGGEWKERDSKWVFPSGAEIILRHCNDITSLDDYIGGNIDWGAVDEATQFPKEWVDDIDSAIRTTNPHITPQLCLTSNPGGKGHGWLKKEFVDPCPPLPKGEPVFSERFDLTYQPKQSSPPYKKYTCSCTKAERQSGACKAKGHQPITVQFIPALVFDNPTLIDNNPKYVEKLKNLPPAKRKMWLEGDWESFSGQFFDMWDHAIHVIPTYDDNRQKIYEFGKQITPRSHSFYRFYDFGTKANFVCLFAAYTEDRHGPHLIIFDELVEKGLSATQQAELVNSYTLNKYKLAPDDFLGEIADPSMFHNRTEKDGELYSQAEFYADQGIYLERGNNKRQIGAAVVYEHLTPKGPRPTIQFTDNCEYMIDTMPNLVSKENDPEDVDSEGEDHGYDALRYGTMQILAEMPDTQATQSMGWQDRLAKGLTYDMKRRKASGRKRWLAR